MSMSLAQIIDFLTDLAHNNSKPWFAANRARYEAAHAAFADLIAEIIARFEPVEDLGALTPDACLFRIHRDVRFSKDKSPYKANFGALIGRDGRRSTGRSYYIHLAPDGSFLGGGLHQPTPDQLAHIRQHILSDSAPLRTIVSAPDFVRCFGGLEGESLKSAPQGYDRSHPDIDLLRRKQFLAIHPLTPAALSSADPAGYMIDVFAVMKPFVTYIAASASAPPDAV